MSDEKLSLFFFDIGFVLMLISMVIGPFGVTNWAMTTGVVACFLALASIALAFQNWEDQDAADDAEEKERNDPNK